MSRLSRILVLVFFALTSSTALCQQNPLAAFHWQFGPGKEHIGDKATITIPKGYVFLDAPDTKKFMALNHNLDPGNEYMLARHDMKWFALFRFAPVGYVKDTETIDANALLAAVKKGTVASNEERQKRGWDPMSVVGWRFRPQYDKQAKLLEWAFLAKDDRTNQEVINYNTRLLGRTGVMRVVLVSPPQYVDQSVAQFKQVIRGYSFDPGQRYSEFRQGDRVAQFGLAALIAGGAAAVATKKGFWALLAGFVVGVWKFMVAAAVGALAWFRSLFKKKT